MMRRSSDANAKDHSDGDDAMSCQDQHDDHGSAGEAHPTRTAAVI